MRFTRGAAVRPEDRACPFCGSRKLSVRPAKGVWYVVTCECEASGAPGRTLKEAWDRWNRRAEEPVEDRQQQLF